MIDNLPTWLRDLIFGLAATLVAWAGTDLVPVLKDKGGIAAIAGAALAVVVAAVAPWFTKAYGVGSARKGLPREEGHA